MTEVVILPGLDGTGTLLENFRSRLRDLGVVARTISYLPNRPQGYDELELHVRAQLPSSRPFVLVGESFSGPLAIRVAADPPAGLVGLVLSTTFARAPLSALARLAPLVRFAPSRPPMPLLSWWLLGRWSTPALRAALAEALHSVSPDVLRTRGTAALRADVSTLVPLVRVPVLQLIAGQDRLLFQSASQALSESLAGGRTLTVDGPHLLLQACADRCALEVASFARGLSPGN